MNTNLQGTEAAPLEKTILFFFAKPIKVYYENSRVQDASLNILWAVTRKRVLLRTKYRNITNKATKTPGKNFKRRKSSRMVLP